MKKSSALILALLITAAVAQEKKAEMIPAGARIAHQTSFRLDIEDKEGSGHCSATAVGPHTILTAEHCISPTASYSIPGGKLQIKSILRDGNDHVLLEVDKKFDVWAQINLTQPETGTHVYIWGNPGELSDVYREGTISGVVEEDDKTVILVDINGFFGDSGSGVFNEKGEVVGVISLVNVQGSKPQIKLMGMFSFGYSCNQLSDKTLCSIEQEKGF